MAQQRVAAWVSSVDVLAWALLIVRCIKLRRELRFSAENDRCGSIASIRRRQSYFRFFPESRRSSEGSAAGSCSFLKLPRQPE